jgi:porphobilinogen synthase
MLFGVVEDKDAKGTSADESNNPVVLCLKVLRKSCPKLMLLADVCLCEYTNHGHCAPLKHVKGEGELIDNDAGVARLVQVALTYAKAGAHMLCPSDMMDGRIGAIRDGLSKAGMHHVSIMAYTSKKASCMYAPFRAAVESTFKGDRRRYQQPIGSSNIAMRAMSRDLREGADVILVKPCLFYGDIIRKFSESSNVPIAAYVVSGEYKMLKDYGEATGCMENVLKESHIGLLRAGVSILITYFTPKLLDYIPSW